MKVEREVTRGLATPGKGLLVELHEGQIIVIQGSIAFVVKAVVVEDLGVLKAFPIAPITPQLEKD